MGICSTAETTEELDSCSRLLRKRTTNLNNAAFFYALCFPTPGVCPRPPIMVQSMGQDSIVTGLVGDGGMFDLVATNEYGEYDRRALALYNMDMVIEVFQAWAATHLFLEG